MDTRKAIVGLVILAVGVALFWNSYNQLTQCSSIVGQIATGISNLFGGNGIATCNNASVLEVVGVILAVAGVGVLFVAAKGK